MRFPTRLVAVGLLLSTAGADADPRKAKALLKQARAAQAKSPAAAVTLLQQALVESPDDPRTLAELGFAAYQAKDLATAEKATRQAIALAKDDGVKAAASYNLGLILTARGDKAGAAAAAADATRLRDARFVAAPLGGPYPSIDAFCATWLARKDPDRDQWHGEDSCHASEQQTTLDGHAVRLVVQGWNGDEQVHQAWDHVAIQVAKGWWIGELHSIDSPGGTFAGSLANAVAPPRVVDLGGGVHAVAIAQQETNDESFDPGHDLIATASDELALCAIGPSGKPSCVTGIATGDSREESEDQQIRKRHAWAVTASFPGDGRIKLTAVRKKGKSAPPRDAVGTHRLTFP